MTTFNITIEVVGPVGCRKSAIQKHLRQKLKQIGLDIIKEIETCSVRLSKKKYEVEGFAEFFTEGESNA